MREGSDDDERDAANLAAARAEGAVAEHDAARDAACAVVEMTRARACRDPAPPPVRLTGASPPDHARLRGCARSPRARAQVHADADNAHDDETSVRAELKRAHADAAEMRAAAAHVAEAFAADGGAARRTRRARPPAALGLVAAARGVSHERVALPCSGARAQRRISPSLPAHWHIQEMPQRQ